MENMKKEELRPVEVIIASHTSSVPKNTKGYFHRYVTNKNENSEETLALIELENGRMEEIYPTWIKFLDRG